MTETFFEARGIYYRANDVSIKRKTLVFIHGLSGSSSAWVRYEEKLGHEYNTLALDLRGHGKSRKWKNFKDYEIERLAEDLNELLEHLGLRECILISHSFGTVVALEFSRKYSSKVISHIFLSPNSGLDKISSLMLARNLIRLFTPILFWLPFSLGPGRHVDYSKYMPTSDWSLRRIRADVWQTGLRAYLFCLRQLCEYKYPNEWSSINVPTLIFHGTRDSYIPVEHSRLLAQKIKKSELIVLEGANHIIVLNNFEEIAPAIEKFIGKEPEFVPKPGQINFTHIRRAPVINCVLRYENKVLIVQRNAGMRFYPGFWNGVSGFLDDERGVVQKAKDEVSEELGIEEKDIVSIFEGRVFEQDESDYNKTWVVHPVLIDVSTDKVTLDWEAQRYEWIEVADAQKFNLLPGFDKVLEVLFPN